MEKESNPTYHRVMENTRPQPVPQGGVFPETAPTERAASEGYGPTGDLTHPPGEVLTSLRRYLLLMGLPQYSFPEAGPRASSPPWQAGQSQQSHGPRTVSANRAGALFSQPSS